MINKTTKKSKMHYSFHDVLRVKLNNYLYAEGVLLVIQLEYKSSPMVYQHLNLALKVLYAKVAILQLLLRIMKRSKAYV